MTSYFPDVNTWLALAWEGHLHHRTAARWFEGLTEPSELLFSRYSQLGLLRLLTNAQVMGRSVATVSAAFAVYDEFLADPRISLTPDPETLDPLMRALSKPFAHQTATKLIGDLYLIAFAAAAGATLVTFDKAMASAARKRRSAVLLLS
jgi:toxin-antitoxin system PIN domain toxin